MKALEKTILYRFFWVIYIQIVQQFKSPSQIHPENPSALLGFSWVLKDSVVSNLTNLDAKGTKRRVIYWMGFIKKYLFWSMELFISKGF